MINEEEKKEIDKLKSLLYTNSITQYGKRKLISLYENLIEKQQKEIENSVSKDKIRETIDRYSMNLEFDYRPMEVIETKEINKLLEE